VFLKPKDLENVRVKSLISLLAQTGNFTTAMPTSTSTNNALKNNWFQTTPK
jgi:hypothetical protein